MEKLWDCVESLRIAASTLLLACGLQRSAHATVPVNDRMASRQAVWRYGEAGDCADIKRKGYKVVVREFSGLCPAQYGVS